MFSTKTLQQSLFVAVDVTKHVAYHRCVPDISEVLFVLLVLLVATGLGAGCSPRPGKQPVSLVRLLGFSARDRVLIVNCDDFGMCHEQNAAIFRCLSEGLATSASLMVPCPAAREAAAWCRNHPDADIGVHLTLTAEFASYRWGPLLGLAVPSLSCPDGSFWPDADTLWRHMDLDEAYRECRAQIEQAYAMGIKPTHIDNHMYSLQSHPQLWRRVYLRLAREFNLPARMTAGEQPPGLGPPSQWASSSGLLGRARRWYSDLLVGDRVEVARQEGILSPEVVIRLVRHPRNVEDMKQLYDDVLYWIPAGKVCELYLHPALDTPALQKIDPELALRQADYEWLMSDRTRRLIRKLNIKLIGYRQLLDAQRALRK